MASFLTSLWESVFTPGPTPTLLIATNASFGALQLLLLVLLVATQSIHFVILSFLCGGLWYAINWFAAEVQAAKAIDDAEKRERDTKGRGTSADPGSDTETETELPTRGEGTGTERAQKAERRKAAPRPLPAESVSTTTSVQQPTAEAEPSPAFLRPGTPASASRTASDSEQQQRRRSLADSDYVSTDSEWEKVSGDEGKKGT